MTIQNTEACATCPAHNMANLKKLGVNMENWDYVIALAGNPNTGKSTVFNALTGLHQHTGNWPGKTVTRAEGGFSYNDHKFKLVDLPGTYSLLSTSTDEEIARDFILFGQPDVTIIVVDATRIERNLNLALQILEITDRAVICLNLMDEAKRNHLQINERLPSKDLGVPVIPAVARQNQGIDELIKTVDDVCESKIICKPHRIKTHSNKLSVALNKLTSQIEAEYPDLGNARWLALRLLEGDNTIIEAFQKNEIAQLSKNKIANAPITT